MVKSDLLSSLAQCFYTAISISFLFNTATGALLNSNGFAELSRHPRDTEGLNLNEGCDLPNHPDFGQWSILGGQGHPKQKVADGTVLQFRCNEGHKLSSENRFSVCVDNRWTGEILTCLKKCPPLFSTESTNIKCYNNQNLEIKCEEATDGSKARISCAPYYEISSTQQTMDTYCRSNSWVSSPQFCKPVCGQKQVHALPLTSSVTPTKIGDYPWVTAIYTAKNDGFTFICVGNMLTQRVILTAAHCVTNIDGNIDNKILAVGVGKYYNKYKDPRDTAAQYSMVEKILVPRTYKGEIQNYVSDIALLITKDELVLSKAVLPVCLLGLPKIYLDEGLAGVISTWGSPDDQSFEILRDIRVTYQPDSVCTEQLPHAWADKYFTFDKMCAPHQYNTTGICQGGSGSGLVFKNEEDRRYYIHGIVSTSFNERGNRCNIQYSAVSTKVALHYDWILKSIAPIQLKFKCRTVEEYIELNKRCDGKVDCTDGSDEFNDCKDSSKCPNNSFRCDYGACINANKKCNGKKDCRDNSDEANCASSKGDGTISSNCKSDEFQCKSGDCIPLKDACNGVPNCKDKSDETKENCFNTFCPNSKFKCDYGACVQINAKCNGVKDCADNSDEQDCAPVTIPTPKPTPPISDSVECELPEHPEFGKWSLSTGTVRHPKEKVPASTILVFDCDRGYKLSSESKYVGCVSTGWGSKIPTCLKKCGPLYSTNVTYVKCLDERNIEIECNQATDGTSAIFSCALYYELPGRYPVTNYCWSGQWSGLPPVCQPVCGEKKVSAISLIVNGQVVERGDYPWVAAMYLLNNNNYSFICGGSIIMQRVILTAAHCNFDKQGRLFDANELMVGVGKYYIHYKDPRDTQAQYSKVSKIIIPNTYKGESRRQAADIALLVTKDVLLLSKVVQPVCLRGLINIFLYDYQLGVITGWGYTNPHDTTSEELRELTVPYKPRPVCEPEFSSDWADKYYTYDKLCAGNVNKSMGVCSGDSGGGLVFKNKKDSRYYVHGIVSLSSVEEGGCDVNRSALYTSVAEHYHWLERQISQYRQ